MPFTHEAGAPAGWSGLTERQQIELSRAALQQAVDMVACQAETLADEMQAGVLLDQGGPEALQLLARVLRIAAGDSAPGLIQIDQARPGQTLAEKSPGGLALAGMMPAGHA